MFLLFFLKHKNSENGFFGNRPLKAPLIMRPVCEDFSWVDECNVSKVGRNGTYLTVTVPGSEVIGVVEKLYGGSPVCERGMSWILPVQSWSARSGNGNAERGQPDERGCPSRLCYGIALRQTGNSSGLGGQRGCHSGSGCSGPSWFRDKTQ